MGFIDLTEQCIKALEKVSQESPRAVLKSGTLMALLNMIDFFDFSTQSKILQVLLNVGAHSESEADFEECLLPTMGTVCQMVTCPVNSE